MAYSALFNLPDGKVLQPYFSEGVRGQLSKNFREFEMVEAMKVTDGAMKEVSFEFVQGYGPASAQMRNPNGSTAFPDKQQISLSQYTAQLKEMDVTLSVNLGPKRYSAEGKNKYASVADLIVEKKLIIMKRLRAKQFYGDGTGAFGQISSTAQTVAAGIVTFTLSSSNSARGHVGWFEKDDIFFLKAADGTTSVFDSNLGTEPYAWQVVNRSHKNNTVDMQPLNSSLANTAAITSISVSAASGELLYRYGQPTIPDTTSISDYGTASEELAGLDSLTASDGRTVHGITMSGFLGGTRYDTGAVQLTGIHLDYLMNDVMIAAGAGQYKYKQMIMAHQARSNLVEEIGAQRHFISVKDEKLGINRVFYQYGDEAMEAVASEFCPKPRIYCLPESGEEKEKVLELYSSDVEPVMDEKGAFWRLEPSSSGGFSRSWVSYMTGRYVMVCKHPASIGVLHNFTLAS